jgi:hypothetical protein
VEWRLERLQQWQKQIAFGDDNQKDKGKRNGKRNCNGISSTAIVRSTATTKAAVQFQISPKWMETVDLSVIPRL